MLYPLLEGGPLVDQERHEFGLIGSALAKLAEMHPFVDKLLLKLDHILYMRHGDDAELAEMGIDHDRLRIGIGYDADTERALELA